MHGQVDKSMSNSSSKIKDDDFHTSLHEVPAYSQNTYTETAGISQKDEISTSQERHGRTEEVVRIVGGKIVKTTRVIYDDTERTLDRDNKPIDKSENYGIKSLTLSEEHKYEVDPSGKPSIQDHWFAKDMPEKNREEPSGRPAASYSSTPKDTPTNQGKHCRTEEVVRIVGGKVVKTTRVVYDDTERTLDRDNKLKDKSENYGITSLTHSEEHKYEVEPSGKPSIQDSWATIDRPEKIREEPSGRPAAGYPSAPKDAPEDKRPHFVPSDQKPKDKMEPSDKPAAGFPSQPKDKPEDERPQFVPHDQKLKDKVEPSGRPAAGKPT